MRRFCVKNKIGDSSVGEAMFDYRDFIDISGHKKRLAQLVQELKIKNGYFSGQYLKSLNILFLDDMKSLTDAMCDHFISHYSVATLKAVKSIFHLLNVDQYQNYLVSVYRGVIYDNLGGMLNQYSGIEQDQERIMAHLNQEMKNNVERFDVKYRQFVKDRKKSSKSIILNVTILILTFVGVIEGAPSITTEIINHIKSCIKFLYAVLLLLVNGLPSWMASVLHL